MYGPKLIVVNELSDVVVCGSVGSAVLYARIGYIF